MIEPIFVVNSVVKVSNYPGYYIITRIQRGYIGIGARSGGFNPIPASSYLVTKCTKGGKRFSGHWHHNAFDVEWLNQAAQFIAVVSEVKTVIRSEAGVQTGTHKRRIAFCQKKILHFKQELARAQSYLDEIEFRKFDPMI